MKYRKKPLCILLALTLLLVPLAGCASGQGDTAAFSYSGGLDKNGFWEGITAGDSVELFDYESITIPGDVHTIPEEDVQSEVDGILAYYTATKQVTNRAVEDGDTVSIDYVGSIDGVEFSGGNTGGAGAEVTIGVTNYIDDFLEQLIGHMPGETFDVEVTFPEDYGKEELNGKDAVFVTTVNYIAEETESELSDAFVAENLSESYGWTTVDEMTAGIRTDLQNAAISTYIQEYLANDVTVSAVPEQLLEYQENSMVHYYEQAAASSEMELADYLTTYMGVSSVDELVESNADYNAEAARFHLVVQAIAEDAGITVGDEDVAAYFVEQYGVDDYAEYEEQFGLPYLKQNVLSRMVMDYLIDHATLG